MPAVDPMPHSATWNGNALSDLATLCGSLGCDLAAEEPLARHTSMGVGGPCPAMVWPRRDDHVRLLTSWMARRELGWRVLGGGTNLLVADRGVPEVVLNTSRLLEGATVGPDLAVFPSGVSMAQALRRAADEGYDGLVWAAGLPGTVGGAAAGNAGCWGSDMAASVSSIDIVDGRGISARLSREDLAWSYRHLGWPSELRAPVVITSVAVLLVAADPRELRARYTELQTRKRERQPVGGRNSGCIFRNPSEGGLSAGQLLDRAGCKGLRRGGAEVSPVHANFVVNRDDATAEEVMALVVAMRSRVLEAYGIELVTEIRRW